jgi:hypothetical protein
MKELEFYSPEWYSYMWGKIVMGIGDRGGGGGRSELIGIIMSVASEAYERGMIEGMSKPRKRKAKTNEKT